MNGASLRERVLGELVPDRGDPTPTTGVLLRGARRETGTPRRDRLGRGSRPGRDAATGPGTTPGAQELEGPEGYALEAAAGAGASPPQWWTLGPGPLEHDFRFCFVTAGHGPGSCCKSQTSLHVDLMAVGLGLDHPGVRRGAEPGRPPGVCPAREGVQPLSSGALHRLSDIFSRKMAAAPTH